MKRSPNARDSIVPPPDYASRAIKTRLLILFGMLILVIILMKEAGKPANWRWMGFDNEPAVPNPVDDTSVDNAAKHHPSHGPATTSTQPNQTKAQNPTTDLTPDDELAGGWQAEPIDYPELASRFWFETIDRMNFAQHRELFQFLKALRTGQTGVLAASTDNPLAKYQSLIDIIVERRSRFHQQAFDQLAILADGSEAKTELADQLFESQTVWEKQILPAFQSALRGEDITLGQQRQIQRLQTVLDLRVLNKVQDRSSIGWAGDSTPWVRLWERVAAHDFGQAEPVSQLQLISQPEYYRGKAVEIEGWVRSARRDELQDSELGVSHYYILWLRPADTKIAPYCVYALTLPEGFPDVTTEFSDYNQPVKVSGLFFKIRSYPDAQRQVRESPVILTHQPELVTKTVPTSVNAWQPSRTTLVFLLALIPIVATVIAWLVYQGTQSKPYQPGRQATTTINRTLDQLKNDASVKTDLEKVMELYQTDGDQD